MTTKHEIRPLCSLLLPLALASGVGGCLALEGEEIDSAGVEEADPGSLLEGHSGKRSIVDPGKRVEAREVNDPPVYSFSWEEGAGGLNTHEQLYASIRAISVTVDIDYPRADGVGIWLTWAGRRQQLRAPDFYSAAQTSLKTTFRPTDLLEQRAYSSGTIEIAGTELAVARDCFDEVSASSSSETYSNEGIFRSRTYNSTQTSYSTKRKCQEFFRPMNVRRVEIKIEYQVPPVSMPTREWRIEPKTLYTSNDDYFDLPVASTVPPPHIMSGVDVYLQFRYPRTLGGKLRVSLNSPAAGAVTLWSSDSDTVERDDLVTIQTRLHDFDERRMDGQWKLLFEHRNDSRGSSAPPGATYEFVQAYIVLNSLNRPPITWKTTRVDISSPHPYFINTVQDFPITAPDGAISCKFGFDRVDLRNARLTVHSPVDGRTIAYISGSRDGSSVLSEPVPAGESFVLRFTTEGGDSDSRPAWGFHMNQLICKF